MVPIADRQFAPDTLEDRIFVVLGILLALGATVFFTSLDGHIRFLVRDTAAYVSNPGEADLTFSRDQVELLNEVSGPSLGRPVAEERLFCFAVSNKQVTQLRLVDRIDESTLTSVSGGCVRRFGAEVDGFIHTHPAGSFDLSEEDRRVESDVDYTCIVADEIVESPSGAVGGIRCWQVVEQGDPAELERVEVAIL